jgi:hypothetical protein
LNSARGRIREEEREVSVKNNLDAIFESGSDVRHAAIQAHLDRLRSR